MKPKFWMIVAAVSLLHPVSSLSQKGEAKPSNSATTVVLELFTSEGCSSCPPADALLAKIESAQPFGNARIIAIEEHVDYWNQQGWVDPFSSVEWTQRQRGYVSVFHLDGEYTPQVIVNGRAQLIGSRMNELTKVISENSGIAQAVVGITQSAGGSDREPRFQITVDNLPATAGDTAEVWVAITESSLSSQVTAGENAGHKLLHAPVLRSLRRIASSGSSAEGSLRGEFSSKLKNEWKRENLAVVVFVQQKKSRHILGASSLRITS